MSDILFVSIGAILGANIRFKIHHKLGNLNLDKGFLILIINTFASFGLGLFLALVEQVRAFTYSYKLILFFSIGFFGSLSTCLLYTSPSPRDRTRSRMPSSA